MFVDLLALHRFGKEKKCSECVNLIPSIISFKKSNQRILIFVSQKSCLKLFNEKVFKNKVIRIFFNNIKYYTKVQSFQMHPFKKKIQSIIFLVILPNDRVNIYIPIKIIGITNCKVLQEGSYLKQRIYSAFVSCFFSQVPDFLEIDVSLLNHGTTIYTQDIQLFSKMSFLQVGNLLKEDYILKIF